MGQTINNVTYYTDAGVYNIPMNQYVPVKFANTVAVENASADAGKTTVAITGLHLIMMRYTVLDGTE